MWRSCFIVNGPKDKKFNTIIFVFQGIPELDVPGLEPLSLGQIALARGPQGAKLTAVVNDVKVRGPSNFIIEELK